jgi:hypothetical protein
MTILKPPTKNPFVTNITSEPFNLFPSGGSSGTAPVIESFSSRGVPATTSLAIAAPSDIQEGELLLGFIASDAVETFTPPTGWTQLDTVTPNGVTAHIYAKTATSSEPSDYTWSISTSEDCIGILYRVSGANTSITNFDGASTSSALTAFSTSVTPTNAGSLMVSFGVHDSTPDRFDQTPATENGFTEVTAVKSRTGSSTGGVSARGFSLVTGSTSQVDATFKTQISEQSISFLIEVEPA